MKTKATRVLTDAQHNDAIRRAQKRYVNAMNAGIAAGLEIKRDGAAISLNPQTYHEDTSEPLPRTVREPTLTVTRTFT